MLLSGFDEGFVAECVKTLRKASFYTVLVGLSQRVVKSQHSLQVLPDVPLDSLAPPDADTIVIVPPGNGLNAGILHTDPRLHQFVETVLRDGGSVIVGQETAQLLAKVSVPDPALLDSYRVVDLTDAAGFLQELLENISE